MIICPIFDLAREKARAGSFVRDIEQWANLFCGTYSMDENKLFLDHTTTKGRFNQVHGAANALPANRPSRGSAKGPLPAGGGRGSEVPGARRALSLTAKRPCCLSASPPAPLPMRTRYLRPTSLSARRCSTPFIVSGHVLGLTCFVYFMSQRRRPSVPVASPASGVVDGAPRVPVASRVERDADRGNIVFFLSFFSLFFK